MIDLDEWKKKLAEPAADVILDAKNESTDNAWTIYGADVKCRSIFIRNASFSTSITFNGLELEGYIVFSNCKINEVRTTNCKLAITKNYSTGLRFSDSEITFMLSIDRCNMARGGLLIKQTKIHILNLHLSETESGILIEESPCFRIQMEKVRAKNIEFRKIDIAQVPFAYNGEVWLENCSSDDVYFYECKLQYVRLSKLRLEKKLFIQKTVINEFSFRNPVNSSQLLCIASNFSAGFFVSLRAETEHDDDFPMKSIRLVDCDFGKNARITGSRKKAKLNLLQLDGNKGASATIDIENLIVQDVSFMNVNAIATLRLLAVEINKLEMFYWQNSGAVYFSSVKPCGDKPVWSITHSQTGNWRLHDCSFEGLDYLEISNSDLNGLRYASIVWFKTWMLVAEKWRDPANKKREIIKNVRWTKLPKSDEYLIGIRNRRELYRMLKEAAENQQDRIQSLRFQQREMYAYQRELLLTQRFYNPDRLALWAGRTNNHGLNWIKPVLLALVITAFFYIGIVIGIDPAISTSDIFHSGAAWQQIAGHWGIFPQLLNPAHSLERMVNDRVAIHPATWYLDYTHRLTIAFFIFQTVAAFRKFIRA